MAEILSIIMFSVLIALCVVFFIVLFLRGGEVAKVFFIIFSSLCALLSIGVGLIWDSDSAWFFERIVRLSTSLPVAVLVLVLECVSIIMLFVAANMLYFKRKRSVEKKAEPEIIESEEIPMPDNCRKADERKHGEYKIIKMG